MDCENIRDYARGASRELAASLECQIAEAVGQILDDPGKKVRLALTVILAVDGQTGMIRPEYSVRRSEVSETRLLPCIPIGMQLEFGLDLPLQKGDSKT